MQPPLTSSAAESEPKSGWVSYHWFVLAVIFAITALRWLQGIDPDLWWHIRAGNWMIDHRQLLQVDLFSSTRYGEAWQHPDWLAQILIAAVYRLGGMKGVFLFFAAIYTAGVALLMRASKTHRAVTLGVALLAVLASEIAAAAKPAMFSYLFVILFLITLEQGAHRTQRIVLPLLMLLWTNLHGGFTLGFALLGLYGLFPLLARGVQAVLRRKSGPVLAPEMRQHLVQFAVLLGLCLGAALINPYGADNLFYLARSTSVQTGAMNALIVEWLPPDFGAANGQILLGVIAAVLVLFALAPRRHLLGYLISALFLGLTLMHVRMVLFWGPVVQFFLGQVLWTGKPETLQENRWIKAAMLGAAAAAVVLPAALVLTGEAIQASVKAQYPAAAADFLVENRQPGNLFNTYHWGGYLQLAAPEYPVFIDGRADLFGDDIIFNRYFKVLDRQDGWLDVLADQEIRYVLVERDRTLAAGLIESACAPVYADETAVLFDLEQCPRVSTAGR